MEKRMEFIERTIGESADKLSKVATVDGHASLEGRLDYLEKFLGESADNHEEHKTTLETRLEYIESLIGDSADKHASEIDKAKNQLGDLHKALAACASAEHH